MPPWLCLARDQGSQLICEAQQMLMQTKATRAWRLKTEQRAMTQKTTPQLHHHGEPPQAATASSSPFVQL